MFLIFFILLVWVFRQNILSYPFPEESLFYPTKLINFYVFYIKPQTIIFRIFGLDKNYYKMPTTKQYTVHGLQNYQSKKEVEAILNTIPGVKAKVFLPDQFFIESEKELSSEELQKYLTQAGDYHLVIPGDSLPDHILANQSESGKYICPMFCEGDKEYDEPGRCPVCNMFLMPVEQVNKSLLQNKTEQTADASCCTGHAGVYPPPSFTEDQIGKYYCPMMCEGDKVYDEMGSCRVCGMNLEKITPLKPKTQFTCPIHNEITTDEPGNCPICGADLVPIEPKEEVDEVYLGIRKKFIISVVFTMPIFLLAMGEMIPGNPIGRIISYKASAYLQFFLCLPVVFYCGWTYFIRAYNSFKTWHLNMFSLIGLGTTAAFLYSLVALFFPQIFPVEFRTHHGQIGLYFESVAVIITLVILGQLMEAKAHSKTNKALKELIKLTPNEAILITKNGDKKILVDSIKIGDQLRVRPGDKIPIDGKIIEGNSDIDESMITGEAIPVSKIVNDKVIGGSINGSGSFIMTAEKIGQDTMLSHIIQMVNSASRTQAPIQRSVDKISKIFVPTVIAVSILTFFAWWIFGGENRVAYAIANAIAVLIVACPCALGLATPMSVMVAVGKGAKNGILVKNAEALERLNQIDTLTIDKTGTLTEGRPSIVKVDLLDQTNRENAIQFAASLNQNSTHPLALAFTELANKENIENLKVNDFSNLSGKGVSGSIDNQKVALGNLRLAQELSPAFHPTEIPSNTTSYLIIEDKVVAVFELSDSLKPTTKEAIKQLKEENIDLIMLTGDNKNTAAKVAEEVGISHYQAEVLPADKLSIIKDLQQKGKIVGMAGDGINDAPALAQANVAIAMDSGTEVAIESADITLLKGDLLGVTKSINLSRAMMKNIKENLAFAFIYNLLGIPIAAGILYPFLGILMSPMIAAAAMSLSSVSVILNSTRLNNVKLTKR